LKTQAGKTTGAHISSLNYRSAIYRRPGLPGHPAQELRERQLCAAGRGAQVRFGSKPTLEEVWQTLQELVPRIGNAIAQLGYLLLKADGE
jgi:hypothetical protein